MLMASPNFGFVRLEIPQGVGSPDMHRSAMHGGVKSRYARDQRQLIGAAGRLLYHHRSSKGTGGYTILAGDVHGNVAALVHLHHPHRGEQRRLEREAAPDKERNQVIPSEGCSIFWDSSTNSPSS
jgi:hypothetical protein